MDADHLGTEPDPADEDPHVYSGLRFVTGGASRFITVTDYPEVVLEMQRLHLRAEQERRDRIRASMLTLDVPATERKRFLSALNAKTAALRNFIVRDIAVFDLALTTAVAEARDVLEQLTGSKVEAMNIARVQRTAETLVELHMMNKLASVLGAGTDIRKLVLEHMGTSNGNVKNMSQLRELLALQASRKESAGLVRQVGATRGSEARGVDHRRTGALYARPRGTKGPGSST